MEAKTGKLALDTVERAPKVGAFSVGVVENDSRRVELLRETDTAFEAQPFAFRPCGDPRERKVGNKMVVVVEPAHVAVAAREEHFHDLAPVALERHMLEELPRLVA